MFTTFAWLQIGKSAASLKMLDAGSAARSGDGAVLAANRTAFAGIGTTGLACGAADGIGRGGLNFFSTAVDDAITRRAPAEGTAQTLPKTLRRPEENIFSNHTEEHIENKRLAHSL